MPIRLQIYAAFTINEERPADDRCILSKVNRSWAGCFAEKGVYVCMHGWRETMFSNEENGSLRCKYVKMTLCWTPQLSHNFD